MSTVASSTRRISMKAVWALFLEKELERYGKNQAWLCEKIDAGKSTVSQWMSGQKKPHGDNEEAIFRAFGYDDVEVALRTLADYASRVKRGEDAKAVEREAAKVARRGRGKTWVAKKEERRINERAAPSAGATAPRRGG